ncbi:MAG: histidine kinase [Bdellovibrionaceae bacterium]|nr:histidine kinase [Pseudobdellovibrionaceae bacterium]
MGKLKRIFAFSRGHSFKDTLMNYLRVILIWCPVVTVLFIFGFGGIDNLPKRFAISMIIASTVASCSFFGSLLVISLYNFYRAKRGQELKKDGYLWGALTSFPFILPGLYLGFSFAAKYSEAIGYSYDPPRFNDYSAGVIFGIMVSGLFTLFRVIQESKAEKQAAELKFRTLENEKLKAQVSALTAQMNPHLLFNSLNTIASTITSNPKSAEDMVVQLSELYRGILKSAKGDMHTLENELLLCKSYLEIEQRRFGPRVEYKIFADPSINPKKIRIPVLLVQPLVENAIKHGISPKKEGGVVSVEVKKDGDNFIIKVTDNGVGINFEKPSTGTGTGLSNCESRIKLKYGEDSKFTFSRTKNSETTAIIQIPLKTVICD